MKRKWHIVAACIVLAGLAGMLFRAPGRNHA